MNQNEQAVKQVPLLAIVDFTFVGIIGLISLAILLFIPAISNMIQNVARNVGYGSAKAFYFVVVNPPPYLVLIVIYLLGNAILCLLAGYGVSKNKPWGSNLSGIAWLLEIINLFGLSWGLVLLWSVML
ncbi:MAG: hypothetical protein ACXACU_09305 [Candidatus Hodarchaeales archaeon]